MAIAALENLVGTMTLAELAQRSGRTVDSIVAFALGKNAPRATSNGARTSKNASPAAPTHTGGAVDTRTQAGREDLDERLLDAVRRLGSAKAKDLEHVGGDEFQRRAALHRLIAKKKIRREGAARGTIYTAKS